MRITCSEHSRPKKRRLIGAKKMARPHVARVRHLNDTRKATSTCKYVSIIAQVFNRNRMASGFGRAMYGMLFSLRKCKRLRKVDADDHQPNPVNVSVTDHRLDQPG
jgi:hypothetical protein